MQKYKKIILLILFTILIAGCSKNEYKVDDEVSLKGKISTTEIRKDDKSETIKMLELDEPIIIDGTKVHKIELDYDKNLKDGYEVEIKGTLKSNGDSNYQLSYAFEVIDIDDVLSYINTFSNEDFSFSIPSELIKKVNVEEIDNGFAIYSANSSSYELFRIYTIPTKEFKSISSSNYIKAVSNAKKVVVIKFNDTEDSEENSSLTNEIMNNINHIKETVHLK